MVMRIAAGLLLTVVGASTALGQGGQKRIVLWNAKEMFSVAAVNGPRASDLQDFAAEFDDIDVLILDEVTSLAVVEAVRDKLGLSGFHAICSDFSQNDTN